MELYEFLEKFKEYLMVERGYSYHTIDGYSRDIGKFVIFLNNNSLNIEELTISDLQRFINYLIDSDFSESSVERCVAAIRTFFKFIYIHYGIKNGVVEILELPKKEETIPDVMTFQEVEKLLEQPDLSDPRGLRDRAIMELLYATGARISEALHLRVYDVDFDEDIVRIAGKGSKERIVPFHLKAKEILLKYIYDGRVKLIKKMDIGYLFLNNKGGRLSRVGFWKILKFYGSKIGLEKKVHPHIFRHTFATHMLISGCDLRVLQELLGHSSISTTQRYTSLSIEHLKEVHRKYHPRA